MNTELAILQLIDCIQDIVCMIPTEGDSELKERLENVYSRAGAIRNATEILVAAEEMSQPQIPELLNFKGLWKLNNGGYAKVLSFDDSTKQWSATLYQEDGVEAGTIFYDMFGNTEDGNVHLTLVEKKRGEEHGWPDV